MDKVSAMMCIFVGMMILCQMAIGFEYVTYDPERDGCALGITHKVEQLEGWKNVGVDAYSLGGYSENSWRLMVVGIILFLLLASVLIDGKDYTIMNKAIILGIAFIALLVMLGSSALSSVEDSRSGYAEICYQMATPSLLQNVTYAIRNESGLFKKVNISQLRIICQNESCFLKKI